MSQAYQGPGVNVAIKQLSSYVQAVPSSIGMCCFLAPQGEDNVLKYFTSQEEFLKEYGELNSLEYPLPYSLGKFIGSNFLQFSGAFYGMRCLPEDAQYALAILNFIDDGATSDFNISYSSETNKINLKNALSEDTTNGIYPLCVIAGKGRGVFYNKYSFQISQSSNPISRDVFILDIHERLENYSGKSRDQIVESFEISFNPDSKDLNGESLYIVDVLENYSAIVRAYMTKAPATGQSDGDMSEGYKKISKIYDQNIGEISIDTTTSFILTDSRQDFSDWTGNYGIILMDGRGNAVYGYLNTSTESGSNDEKIKIYQDRNLTTIGVLNYDTDSTATDFDFTSHEITYEIHKIPYNIGWYFSNLGSSYTNLKRGSDGNLITSGTFNYIGADDILEKAFSGKLENPNNIHDALAVVSSVINTEFIYFTEIYDPGYSKSVKTKMVDLVKARENCVLITDNGDNHSFDTAIDSRSNDHDWNSYYVSIFEGYSQIEDIYANRNMWVSPVFHMSYLIPQNDSVNEIWNAVAGTDFNITSINQLRYEPNRSEISSLYLKQLNPIVHFREGFLPWGNLTSQFRPGPMQDLNIVRMMLWVSEALKRYSRAYIFKANDSETWAEVSKEVNEFLADVQNRRGLYSFNVDVGATDYEIKTKKFHINVNLFPTRVVEQINLTFFVE